MRELLVWHRDEGMKRKKVGGLEERGNNRRLLV